MGMARPPESSPQTLRVFEALLAEPASWQYGYALSRQTGLKSGTLYPLLSRLAQRGVLDARWQPPAQPGRPPRHAYRLTATGERVARARLAASRDRPLPGPARPLPQEA